MNRQKNKLICLLLVLAVLAGTIAGCATESDRPSQTPPLISVPTTSDNTVPITPSESQTEPTVPTEVPSEPTVPTAPPTEPAVTEPPAVTPPVVQPPAIGAAQSFIYDTRIHRFVYASTDIDTALYPASITKLFTSYVALQFLEPTDSVTIGNELSLVAQDASVAGLKRGSTWTVEGLLYASLLPSGCDASYVLAVAAGRNLLLDPEAPIEDALHAFMTQCNFLAWELGMENTNLVTPDGYHHNDHYISIMAYPIIADCILSNDILSSIAQTPQITVSYTNASGKTRTKHMNNTNKLLRSDYPEFYRSEAVGLKTGSTSPAGGCLLTAYQVEDGYIIIGVFGCSDKNIRFSDANTLFDYYIELQ